MQSTPIGIRKTNVRSWAVVLSQPTSVVPSRQPAALILGDEFSGPGAKAAAIKAAGTNRVLTGAARETSWVSA